MNHSLIMQAMYFKWRWNFLQWISSKFIHLQKIFCERVLSYYAWYSRNYSYIQMALRTNHFVGRTFRGSNWSPGKTVGRRFPASDSKTVLKSRLISRVQIKSNWTVDESLLTSDSEIVRECRLNLLKRQWNVLQSLIWKFIDLQMIFCRRVLS